MTVPAIFRDAVAASWAQAFIYVCTLAVLIRQTRVFARQAEMQREALDKQAGDVARQVQMQREALDTSEYLRCQIDFTQNMRLLIDNNLHARVYDDLGSRGCSTFVGWTKYTDIDKQVYAYLELLYELFERVFCLVQDRSVPSTEWPQWESWIDDVIRHPLFRDIYEDNRGMFDPRFESFINARLQAVGPLGSKV